MHKVCHGLVPGDCLETPGHALLMPPAANSSSSQRKWRIFVCVLLILGTLVSFSPVLYAGFLNYDDDNYVTGNRHVQAGLSWDGLRWAFTTTALVNWHPLTWLSFQLDRQIYGNNAWGFHLTNLLLHLASAIVLFHVLEHITSALWSSALV